MFSLAFSFFTSRSVYRVAQSMMGDAVHVVVLCFFCNHEIEAPSLPGSNLALKDNSDVDDREHPDNVNKGFRKLKLHLPKLILMAVHTPQSSERPDPN